MNVIWVVVRRHRASGVTTVFEGMDSDAALGWDTEAEAEEAIVRLGLDQDPEYDVVAVPATKRSTN